jgi:hypothetical protein
MEPNREELIIALSKRNQDRHWFATPRRVSIAAILVTILITLEAFVKGENWGQAGLIAGCLLAVAAAFVADAVLVKPRLRTNLRRYSYTDVLAASEIVAAHHRKSWAIGQWSSPGQHWSAQQWLSWMESHLHEVLSAARHGDSRFFVLPYNTLSVAAALGLMMIAFELARGFTYTQSVLIFLLPFASLSAFSALSRELDEYLQEQFRLV